MPQFLPWGANGQANLSEKDRFIGAQKSRALDISTHCECSLGTPGLKPFEHTRHAGALVDRSHLDAGRQHAYISASFEARNAQAFLVPPEDRLPRPKYALPRCAEGREVRYLEPPHVRTSGGAFLGLRADRCVCLCHQQRAPSLLRDGPTLALAH